MRACGYECGEGAGDDAVGADGVCMEMYGVDGAVGGETQRPLVSAAEACADVAVVVGAAVGADDDGVVVVEAPWVVEILVGVACS